MLARSDWAADSCWRATLPPTAPIPPDIVAGVLASCPLSAASALRAETSCDSIWLISLRDVSIRWLAEPMPGIMPTLLVSNATRRCSACCKSLPRDSSWALRNSMLWRALSRPPAERWSRVTAISSVRTCGASRAFSESDLSDSETVAVTWKTLSWLASTTIFFCRPLAADSRSLSDAPGATMPVETTTFSSAATLVSVWRTSSNIRRVSTCVPDTWSETS